MTTVAPFDLEEHVECATFIGDEAAFALADGRIVFASGRELQAHDGLLAAIPTSDGRILSGGEDGRVCLTGGAVEQCAERPGRWIDAVAAGPNGAVAFASGRTAWIVDAKGKTSEHETERAIEGIAFAPKGLRIACARYGGVSMFFAGSSKSTDLAWEGAHTGVVFAPDGRHVVTTMQENALHGWRIDGKGDPHMRMSGYPAKVKSVSWSAKGRWLATAGASCAVCWPFSGKGPQGTTPKQLGDRADTLVTVVACHPSEQVVAIGYRDGMVMAVRIEDGAENMLRRPTGAEVTSINWDLGGTLLAFGCNNGEAGVINL